MILYLIISFIAFSFTILSFLNKKDNVFFFLVFLLLIGIFAGSRYEIGGSDYFIYEIMYDATSSDFSDIFYSNDMLLKITEKGYIFIMSVAKLIGLTFNEFLLVLGIGTAFGLFYLFNHYSQYLFFTLFIFLGKGFLYYFFTAQRQIIAIIICWFSIKYLISRSFFKFLVLILLASLFHISAVFFLLLYLIKDFKFKNLTVLVLIVLAAIVGFLNIGPYLFNMLASIIPFASGKLMNYSAGGGRINILNFAEMLPLLFIVIANKKTLMNNTKFFNLFFNMFVLYILVNFAFIDFPIIIRLRGYLIIGYITIIAGIPYCFKGDYSKIIILVAFTLYFSAVYIRELLTFDKGEGYLPYNSFLF